MRQVFKGLRGPVFSLFILACLVGCGEMPPSESVSEVSIEKYVSKVNKCQRPFEVWDFYDGGVFTSSRYYFYLDPLNALELDRPTEAFDITLGGGPFQPSAVTVSIGLSELGEFFCNGNVVEMEYKETVTLSAGE